MTTTAPATDRAAAAAAAEYARSGLPPAGEGLARITEPGVYDLTNDEYHSSDPVPGGSLTATGARKLLKAPSKFLTYVRGEEELSDSTTDNLNAGKLAHAKVLGQEPNVHVTDVTNLSTKAGRAAKEEAETLGVPLVKRAFMDRIEAMAEALLTHPLAATLLERDASWTEQTLLWRDERTGVNRRGMLDVLPHWALQSGIYLIPDYKTADDSDPRKFGKTIYSFGYHIQAEWYADGVRALGLAGGAQVRFCWIVQEKRRPYDVTVIQMDNDARYWAQVQIRAALDTYLECRQAGRWPGYSDEMETATLPRYAAHELEQLQEAGALPRIDSFDLI